MTEEPKKKFKIALYWCASCGGCEEAVVDLAEDILKVIGNADIVFWPVAMDFKKEDVEQLPDGSIDVAFINGAVRMSEHEEMVKLLRRKAKLVVAFGSCACFGGIPGLANLWNRETIFSYVYGEAPTVVNPENVRPAERLEVEGVKLELPEFWNTVRALDQVIDVDYYIPGCAPPPDLVKKAVEAVFSGELPPKGTVIASNKALCDECDLNKTKPDKIKLKELKRVHQVKLELDKCYLAQGVVCLGPVTRGGCGTLCIKAGMPCTGCFGPLDNVIDYGARALSYLASILDYDDEEEAKRVIEEMVVDPVGLFYKLKVKEPLAAKWRAFGWDVVEVSRANVKSIIAGLERSSRSKRPTAIIIHTAVST